MGECYNLSEVPEIEEKFCGYRGVEEELLHERAIGTDLMAN